MDEYPDVNDLELQRKLYKKREFHYYRIPEKEDVSTEDDIRKYRDERCSSTFMLQEHQNMLSNFINPNTPYRGLILFHGVGSGKTATAVSIAEKFKSLVLRYKTKIYVLVPGRLLKEKWKTELIKCTGNTYIDDDDILDPVRKIKLAIQKALNYYKFITYKGFYKKVLGEKVFISKGQYQRELSIDKIQNLNNTLIIVDEAHGLTNNEFGDALTQIIKNSFNLRILLLTATPMKNLADDIISLLNFIRPQTSQIERDKVFTSEKNHEMKFKQGGEEYLKNMARGYISHIRGSDPLTYAKRIDVGKRLKTLIFTNVIPCIMEKFQHGIYTLMVEELEDSLDRNSEAISNFVFPVLNEDNTKIVGVYGNYGKNILISQLHSSYRVLLNELVGTQILNLPKNHADIDNIIDVTNKNSISGHILGKYLNQFSCKYNTVLKNLNELFDGKKGPKTAFIYSNLVKNGIELFRDVLLWHGYLEYDPQSLTIASKTICYYCGIHYEKHAKLTTHTFQPACFLLVTGQSEDDNTIPEEKQYMIEHVFNTPENKNGKFIKFILGSKVINEGLDLKNVSEVHIIDVYYNLGRVDQVVGRAIRHCSHYTTMVEDTLFPDVYVFKYCISMEKETSAEERLFYKAEQKYLLVKKVEHILKEVAIDCPLNMNANIFPYEMKEYKNCKHPLDAKENDKICPSICDFTKCSYQCYDKMLNNEYYDPERNIYKKIKKEELDFSTFTNNLAKSEINMVKQHIQNLYILKHIYSLSEIIQLVKSFYPKNKLTLFDDFFVYQALDELVPTTQNELNNFKDFIYDKFNNKGCLNYINGYYIFQPWNKSKNITMYYRTHYLEQIPYILTLGQFLKLSSLVRDMPLEIAINETKKKITVDEIYDLEYYQKRNEFDIIGLIDYSLDEQTAFKIREKRSKILEKKRAKGLPSFKGAVCVTKDKGSIQKICKQLGIDYKNIDSRGEICLKIRDILLHLEKYSSGKGKMTYTMVPKNHPLYKFPYNLEDQVEYIKDIVTKICDCAIDISTETINVGSISGVKLFKQKVKTFTLVVSGINEENMEKIKNSINFNVVVKNKSTLVYTLN